MVKAVLSVTLGNITHIKDRKTLEFGSLLSLRRELKFEYLYYRENLIKLRTELEYAQREVPANNWDIKIIKTKLNNVSAGLSRVRAQIQEIDAKYPLINMEKEMMNDKRQDNGDFDGYVSIFEQLYDSNNRLSILEEQEEVLRNERHELQDKVGNIEINQILLGPLVALGDAFAKEDGRLTSDDRIKKAKSKISDIKFDEDELSRKISVEKKLNDGLRKLVEAEAERRNAGEEKEKEEVSA